MRALFACAALLNALLLFLVQPMTAKALLPLFGGSAAVWTACMLFYQAALLAGYAYAHALAGLPGRVQAALHLGLLAAAALALPPGPPAGWAPEPGAGTGALLGVLLRAAGAPLLVLAAGAPLLQRWYARRADPYFLYAASNLGSFAALLAYPFAVEPLRDLNAQGRLWSWGYAGLGLLWLGCALSARGGEAPAPAGRTTWRTRLLWAALAAVPSSLMLGVTTHLTTDIAPAPLLWVVPLALYLATFVAAFSPAGPALTRWCAAAAPPAALLWAFAGLFELGTKPALLLHLGLLGALAAALHGRLAAERPAPARLTEYYLWLAAGGALGGLFNGLLAPALFDHLREYPVAIVAALLLLPAQALPGHPRGGEPGPWWRPASATAAAAALLLWLPFAPESDFLALLASFYKVLVPAALLYHLARTPGQFRLAAASLAAVFALRTAYSDSRGLVERARDFHGVLSVKSDPRGWTTLTHGITIHGRQWRDPERRREPLTYYHPTGPAGDVFDALKSPARVAVVGLGAGMLAAYAEEGDDFDFYELDPLVEELARRHFTYLADAAGRGARLRVVFGDARLSLARQSRRPYDLIVVDAFSSDAVPAHLVTREALALYRSRLAPGGVLAFHVTNRHLRLARVFARPAAEAGLLAVRRFDEGEAPGKLESEWVVLGEGAGLAAVAKAGGWQGLRALESDPLWTDAWSSLWPILR